MKRVGLVGFFGWGNFGDELMLCGWEQAFEGSAHAEKVNTLTHRPYFEGQAEAVAYRYDALVIGGGDLIHPDSISSLYWNRSWTRRPLVIAGIGVALERGRERDDVLERLSAFLSADAVLSIGLRDQESADWVRSRLNPSRPLEVSADLGFANELPPPDLSRNDCVGIVLRKSPTAEDQQVVRRLLGWSVERGLKVELLVLATGTEREREEEALRAVWPDLTVRTENSVQDLLQAIGGYRCIFTAKFHGAVIASRYGVPSLSLRHTHKIAALAHQLNDPELALHPADLSDTRLWEACRRQLPERAIRQAEQEARDALSRAADAVLAV